jgi:aryl-alcohol dehydrogenase-like predicted oxidoreductase
VFANIVLNVASVALDVGTSLAKLTHAAFSPLAKAGRHRTLFPASVAPSEPESEAEPESDPDPELDPELDPEPPSGDDPVVSLPEPHAAISDTVAPAATSARCRRVERRAMAARAPSPLVASARYGPSTFRSRRSFSHAIVSCAVVTGLLTPGTAPAGTNLAVEYRPLGRTGWNVSVVSFGAWAIGGTWGNVDDRESLAALHRALDAGINFFDTADVYGDGRSERLLGELRRTRKETFFIATKAGRRLPRQTVEGYSRANLTAFVERSLKNLGVATLDLLQLHCPPTDLYYHPAVFGILEDLVAAGKLRHYGVSVERVEEALKAIEFPGVQSVQIIYNAFRQRPAELFFPEARRRHVGILARVPLSSGMLAGKMTHETRFADDDHRAFNREGAAFDRGETFSGVPYDVGLEAVEELRTLVPEGATLAQLALRWILMADAVTCVIPGAKRPSQVDENARAADLAPLSPDSMAKVRAVYDERIRPYVQAYW